MHKPNSLIRRAIIILVLTLCLLDTAVAGDNAAIGVYFSIPVVPGLNAPLDAKTELIQEESSGQILLSEAKDSKLTTIYYR